MRSTHSAAPLSSVLPRRRSRAPTSTLRARALPAASLRRAEVETSSLAHHTAHVPSFAAPSRTSAPRRVAVVGGGITGLTAAYALVRAGVTVRLFEADPRLGGAIASERSPDGWLIEAGPNSLQENSPVLTRLIAELDLTSERVVAQPAAKNRYILRDGRPVVAPTSPPALFTSKLFGLGTKLRILGELFHRRRARAADLPLSDFVRAHFGAELVDYGLDPFVSGVYAGDPAQLSARHAFPSLWRMEREHGSIIRGQLADAQARRAAGGTPGPPALISFREGLGRLPAALAAALPPGTIETSAPVTALRPGSPWTVTWTRDNAPHPETFDRVILALPAAALAALRFGANAASPFASLTTIASPAVTSLFLGYKRAQVTHPLDGFGLLVPSREQRDVLGVLFSSTLFAERAPPNHVALTVMLGGTRRPDLGLADLPAQLSAARRELAAILGVAGDPVFVRRTVWPRAIPQYDLGYEIHLATLAAAETAHPGLLIGGNVRDGIAVPACLASGESLAARALAA